MKTYAVVELALLIGGILFCLTGHPFFGGFLLIVFAIGFLPVELASDFISDIIGSIGN